MREGRRDWGLVRRGGLEHVVHADPLAADGELILWLVGARERLLPDGDLVIAAANSEQLAADRPAHRPDDIREAPQRPAHFPLRALRVGRRAQFGHPYKHHAVLSGGGDELAPREARYARTPGHVAHPVGVSLELCLEHPALRLLTASLEQHELVFWIINCCLHLTNTVHIPNDPQNDESM